jgi:tRNA(Arg) A34 adenosine deaminase TadA
MYMEGFRLGLTYYVKFHRFSSGDVALLWDGDKIDAIQTASTVMSAGTSFGLPIVQLLRNRGERFGKRANMWISTTAAPTEACLGMARMCGIKGIFYFDGGMLCEVACNRNGTTVSKFKMSYDGTIPNVTFQQGRNQVNAAWDTNPGNFKQNMAGWVNFLIRTQPMTIAGTGASAAKFLPLAGAAAASKFQSSGLEYLGLKAMVADQAVVDKIMMMLAFEMVSQVAGFTTSDSGVVATSPGQRSTAYKGQNIGSLLTDGDGNIVSWGFNTNSENSTRHGEINLIVSFLESNPGEDLPKNGAIYTTLEPCEMCSGAIARVVPAGANFRVIYGQKDENVTSTALQRRSNPNVTMLASSAMLATPEMLKMGTAVGATNQLPNSMKVAQDMKIETSQEFKATTKFLKEESTFNWYFAAGRPNWWLYLWDYMTKQLVSTTRNNKLPLSVLLNDPQVMKLNNQLEVIYELVSRFMKNVRSQALST